MSHKRVRTEESGPASVTHGDVEAASSVTFEDTTVVLNVGGTLVTTLKSTLCSQPSRFSEWIRHDFKEFPRDEEGHPFIDRDAANFKHIVNYMRGYGLPNKSADLVLLAEDAVFYEVEALRREIGMDQPLAWRFNPGPGVSADGMEFGTSNILGVCGTEPLAHGETHTRFFRIDRCERVAIGLIGATDVGSIRTDQQLHDQKMTVSYCSTGELIHYWYADKLYTTGSGFKAQDIIEIRVEFPDESDGPMTSRALFAPYLDASGQAQVTSVTLPPPYQQTTTTAVGTTATTDADDAPAQAPPPPVQTVRSPSFAAASAPVTNVDAESVLPVYVGPSPSLSHAYSSLSHNRSGGVTAYDNTSGESVPIGAVITIIKAGRVEFVVHWPHPVPPLHYAISMQGSSSVTLLEAGGDAAPLASPFGAVTAGSGTFANNLPSRETPAMAQAGGPPPSAPPMRLPPPVGSRRRVVFEG